MSTYAELQDALRRRLRDVGAQTFTPDDITDMLGSGYSAVQRVAPREFQEDLDVEDGQFTYQLLTSDFTDAQPTVSLKAVEVWSADTPTRPLSLLQPLSAQPVGFSNAGWRVWAGALELPYSAVRSLTSDQHILRVWGYSPYIRPSGDDDPSGVDAEREDDILLVAAIEGLKRLTSDRATFAQWQTHSGNTDTTMGSLLSDLNVAQQEWRDRKSEIAVLREAPG